MGISKAIPKWFLQKYVAMSFMLNWGLNKVRKGKDHCYQYVQYCCSWDQVGEHHEFFQELGGNIFKTPKSEKKKKFKNECWNIYLLE
jgi:hypothetical protein